MSTLERAIETLKEHEKEIAFGLLSELYGILMGRENEVCPKELAIYNSIPPKISRNSFISHCDENHISEKLARNYCLVSSGGWGIDQVAQSASFMIGNGEGNHVEVSDVVEFMNSYYRGGVREFIRKNLTAKMKPVVEQLNNLGIIYNYTHKHKKIIIGILQSRIKTNNEAYNNEDVPF